MLTNDSKVSVVSKLQFIHASRSSHSWLSKQPKLVQISKLLVGSLSFAELDTAQPKLVWSFSQASVVWLICLLMAVALIAMLRCSNLPCLSSTTLKSFAQPHPKIFLGSMRPQYMALCVMLRMFRLSKKIVRLLLSKVGG